MSGMTLRETQKIAFQVFKEINDLKKLDWSPFVIVTDLLEEAGEVASAVKSLEGYKPPEKVKTKEMLATELSDLLYGMFVLAEHYKIDMEEAFMQTLQDYKRRFLK